MRQLGATKKAEAILNKIASNASDALEGAYRAVKKGKTFATFPSEAQYIEARNKEFKEITEHPIKTIGKETLHISKNLAVGGSLAGTVLGLTHGPVGRKIPAAFASGSRLGLTAGAIGLAGGAVGGTVLSPLIIWAKKYYAKHPKKLQQGFRDEYRPYVKVLKRLKK